MQVMVTFRHVEPTEGLRQHAEEKVQRVQKFLRRPIDAHVILSVEKQRHIAEVQLTGSHLNAHRDRGDRRPVLRHRSGDEQDRAPGARSRWPSAKTARATNHGRSHRAGRGERSRAGARHPHPTHGGEADVRRRSGHAAQACSRTTSCSSRTPPTRCSASSIAARTGNYGLIEPELS